MNSGIPRPAAAAVSALEDAAAAWLCHELPQCSVTGGAALGSGGVKPLVDLSLFALVRERLRPADAVRAAILRHLRREIRTPEYRDLLIDNGNFVHCYGLPYAAMVTMGEDDPVGHVIRAIVRSGLPLWTERTPHRLLDVLFFLRLLGMSADRKSDEILPFSSLTSHPNVLLVTEPEAYAMAHTAMYATDFGLRQAAWPDTDLDDVRDLVDVLLERAVANGSVDLAAELMCASICVSDGAGPMRARVAPFLDLLATSRQGDGSWPRYARDRVPGSRPRAHHATLVVALALAMMRRALDAVEYPVGQFNANGPRTSHQDRVKHEIDAVVTRGSLACARSMTGADGRFDTDRPPTGTADAARLGRDALWRLSGDDGHRLLAVLRTCLRQGDIRRRDVLDGTLLLTSRQDDDGLIRCCDDDGHHAAFTASVLPTLAEVRARL